MMQTHWARGTQRCAKLTTVRSVIKLQREHLGKLSAEWVPFPAGGKNASPLGPRAAPSIQRENRLSWTEAAWRLVSPPGCHPRARRSSGLPTLVVPPWKPAALLGPCCDRWMVRDMGRDAAWWEWATRLTPGEGRWSLTLKSHPVPEAQDGRHGDAEP